MKIIACWEVEEVAIKMLVDSEAVIHFLEAGGFG